MRFLIKVAFWLAVVAVLLPSSGSQGTLNVSALDAMSAAKATVGDMRSFCERQPEACSVGAAIGYRAQAGAKLLYQYVNEHLAGNDATSSHGTTGKTAQVPPARASQHTLMPADVAVPWRGSPSQKDAQRSACSSC